MRGPSTLPRRPSAETGLASLLPSGRGAMRRFGGLALLGSSLWLIGVVAFIRAVMALFS